ncbi:hypothetical protein ACQKM1_15635 [Peribacillus frigoritolerans]|uniref:hypothetical protein n=1 Tax=Peribacillus frigoritolerans TaxID=450367 RepID=UPI003D089278
MTNTKSIFELKQQYENIKQIAYNHIQNSFSFYKFAFRELLTLELKLHQKSKIYISSFICNGIESMKQGKNTFSEEVRRIINQTDFVDHYSKYNIFVWIKRYHRLHKELYRQLYEHKKYSRHLLSCLKELNNDLQQHQHAMVVKGIFPYIDVIKEDLLTITSFKFEIFDCYTLIEQMFLFEPIMDINDFLSLINIRKERGTLEVINSLPEKVSIEDFENAVFVEGIEDDSNYYLRDSMIKHIFKVRDANPTLAKEMDKQIGIDMIPTMSVSFNDYGEVSEIKQNPPKLKIVK